MKLSTLTLLIVFTSLSSFSLSAQCTTGAQYPTDLIILDNGASPVILGVDLYAEEYTDCTNVQAGKSYTVTSSVATDFITVTDVNGLPLSGAYGAQPLTFTAPSVNDIRVYRHLDAACGAEAANRTVTVTCIDCGVVIPTNNNCTDAASLNGPGGPTGFAMVGTSLGATPTLGLAACSGVADDDVWYKFTTGATGGTGSIIIDGNAGFNAVIQVYSGTCVALNAILCQNSNPNAGGTETATLTGLAPNTEYYIRVYDYATGLMGAIDDRSAGGFTIEATGIALPATLTSFSAKTKGQSNLINWISANERNVEWYVVERSKNGIDQWTKLEHLAAVGNSSTEQRYQVEDNAPYDDTYYRLRTIDFSGSESLSDIAYLRQAQSHIGAISIYPSPTTGITHLAFTSHSEGTVSIKVFDIAGRNVLAQMAPIQEGMNSMVTDLTGMNSGIYTMIVNTDTDLPLQVKVVKQ